MINTGRAAGALSLAALLCLAMGPLAASDATRISGRITDSSGQVGFEGARVRVEGTSASAISGRDGRYELPPVPPGDYRLIVEYLGAEREEVSFRAAAGAPLKLDFTLGESDELVHNVLVVGQGAGQASAINRQRHADGVKSVVSADAIGDFPDQNVAEALQRVAGLSLSRDQGEGRFVVVRGIDPALNSTTVNGMRVPGPEDDSRQVNLDVISADLLESLEVSKTVTPDMDGDAIGGNIELKSATAFDRGNRVNLRAEASYNELADQTSPRLAATASRLFSLGGGQDNVGVSGAISWFDRDFGSDNIETAGAPEIDGPGGTFRGLEEAEQRDYTITRERLSTALNFDFRPADGHEFFWRNLYSDFSDDEIQRSNVFVFEDGDVAALSDRRGRFTGATVEKLSEAREETQEIFASVLGGRHRLRSFVLDYALGHAFASEDQPEALNIAFVGEGIDAEYDLSDREKPRLVGGSGFLDPDVYVLDEIEREDSFTEERETSLALNLAQVFELGQVAAEWKVGAKGRWREKENDVNATIYDGFPGDPTLADFPNAAIEYPLGRYGLDPSRGALERFFRDSAGSFDISQDDSDVASLSEDYELSEDILAGFAMLTLNRGPLRVVGGVRVERTEFKGHGTEYRLDEENGSGDPEFAVRRADQSYTDVLPSLNLRVELTEQTVLRAAFSRSVARPGFEQAAPRASIEIEEDDGEFERAAELGNPDLDPLRSSNFDLAIEHYPGGIAVVSGGVFVKYIEDFFVLSDIAGQPGAFADFDEALITLNGGDARLLGIEFSYAQHYTRLPSPFDGLLLVANLTLSESQADLPFRDRDVSLPRQSDSVWNLALGYEKYGLSLRLAASYRNDYLDELGDLDDPETDLYAADHLQLDFSGSLRLGTHYQVYFNAVNLNDEPFYAYFSEPRFSAQYEEYGPTFELGMRASF